MATAAVSTGADGPGIVSTGARQYDGFARLYADARYRPMTTPQDVLIEQARQREEEMLRRWREAQAAQARAMAGGRATAFAEGVSSAAGAVGGIINRIGPGLEKTLGGMVDAAVPDRGATAWSPTPGRAGPQYDDQVRDLVSRDMSLPYSLRTEYAADAPTPEVMSDRGPEQPGKRQIPVYNPDGSLQGYKYVPDTSTQTSAPAQAGAPDGGPIGPEVPGMPSGDNMAGSSAALAGYDPENYRQGGEFNQAWNAGANTQQAYKFDPRRLAVEEQAYGKPVGPPSEGPYGEPIYTYDATYQRYIGIDAQLQSRGYIPTRLPNPLGPNATQAEREKFQKRSEAAFIAPRYVVGQNFWDVQRMDRKGKITLQKKLRDAGLITGYMIPGVFTSDDYKALEEVYGFANQTGYTADQAMKEMKAINDAARAAARSGGGGGGGGGGDSTSINIQYAQTSLAQGRALLARTLSDALGRPPTPGELSEYMAMLNAAENKSPTKTVTNYVRDGSTTTATSRLNPSEVDPEAMARKFAMKVNGGEEFDIYQTTRLMDMLVNRLVGAANA